VALVTVSQAFLIPSTISVAAEDSSPLVLNGVSGSQRLLRLRCPQCKIKTTYGTLSHGTNSDAALELSLEVDEVKNILTANGRQIWPVPVVPATTPLQARQVIKINDKVGWVSDGVRPLEFSVGTHGPLKKSTDRSGVNVILMKFDIYSVDNELLGGIPGINISLRQMSSGRLSITNAVMANNRWSVNPSLSDVLRNCKTRSCRWKATAAAKVAAAKKGCSDFRRPHESARRPHYTISGRPQGIKGGPNKFPHHRPHSLHGGVQAEHDRVSKLLHSYTFNIIVMIFLGAFFCMAARVAGYLVGTFAIFLWRMFFRHGQRGQYARVEVDESSEDEIEDEKEASLESQGPPPLYEDPEVVVVEKSEQE